MFLFSLVQQHNHPAAQTGQGGLLDSSTSTHPSRQGPPRGCVTSPFLFTLLTDDLSSKIFIKFAVGTAVVALINNRNESDYRSKVSQQAE